MKGQGARVVDRVSGSSMVSIEVRQPGTRPVVGPVKRTDGGRKEYPQVDQRDIPLTLSTHPFNPKAEFLQHS